MSLLHPPILETPADIRRLHWSDESDCIATAARLAATPAVRRAFITLEGPLGAGKTTFVRHLLRALGVEGRIKSPTYAVLEPYTVGDLVISHLDLYRLADGREFLDAGLREVFEQTGLKLVEWPDKAAGALPLPDLRMVLSISDEQQREVQLHALSETGREMLG